MIKGLGNFVSFALIFFLILSVLNYSSYVEGVHDCSNMAVEQYMFLKYVGFEDINICVGQFEGYSHAWIKIGNYEYDPVSLFPMFVYRMGQNQIEETRYYIYDTSISHTAEHNPHLSSYKNSIPILFILIFFNILRIKVIRPVIRNEIT